MHFLFSRSARLRLFFPWIAGAIYIGALTAAIYLLFADWAYDDPYIVYRYARNLAVGQGFVYNPGERVLSTTTILFPLLLAGASRLGLDIPQVARLSGAFFIACGGLLLWELARILRTRAAGWACLLLYPALPLMLTTIGSEVPMYLALCLAALICYVHRRYSLASLSLALATLTRPDSLLLGVVLLLHYLFWVSKPFPWQSAAIFVAVIAPWMFFAWHYFGSPIPVTLMAKQFQGTLTISQKFAPGLAALVWNNLHESYFAAQAILAVCGVLFSLYGRRDWVLLWGWSAVYGIAYTLLGVSRYFWYYAPLAASWIAAVGVGIAALVNLGERLTPARKISLPLIGAIAGSITLFVFVCQARSVWFVQEKGDLRYASYRAAGEWLRENTSATSKVGTLEVGIIGYYSERPIVDFAGLIQPEVAPQLANQDSYEGAARWAMDRYRPEYVVLREDVFPSLEATYLAQFCRKVFAIPANSPHYPWAVNIYHCFAEEG
jgi:hypothetical protein